MFLLTDAKCSRSHCSHSMILLGLSLVSIRVGLEGDRIHDSLVVDQLILLVLGEGEELIVFGIAYNLI